MTRSILYLIIFLGTALTSYSQDSTWQRQYGLYAFNRQDLRNSSFNGLSANRILHDAFRKNVKPLMGEKWGNVTYGIYSFGTTYMTLIWSHEFGHVFRADQVGGEFRIHNGNLPIPYTTMHLPEDISYPNEALSVTGGFEVNHLTVRRIQREFIQQNGIYNEDLAYAFANRMMHTIYTSLIIPIDPEEKDVWIKTAGDPVHWVLPVFKEYADEQVFMPDSTVNPELVDFYGRSALFATIIHLADPQFYREIGATFGSGTKTRRPIFLLGDHHNGWTYGTLFNASPLGYELYLNNYIHWNDRQMSLYFKYGDPFKNNGLGLWWHNVVDQPGYQLGAGIEAWDQDIYGSGMSAEVQGQIALNEHFDLDLSAGYKSEGYLLGKPIDQGFNLGFGLIYSGSYF